MSRVSRLPRPVDPPAPAPRRSGLVVLLLLFLGVNSVVLALVVWDKFGAKLPWVVPSEPIGPPASPVPVLSPTPTPGPEPAFVPMVVVEQTPPAAPLETETPPPAAPTETPSPEPTPTPTPTPTAVPTPTVLPALPPGAIPPIRTTDVRPTFSDDLMRRHGGLDGRVELEVLVLADGSIGSIHVVRGVDPEINEIVVQAAWQQLSYAPASLKGRPIPARNTVIVGVRFRLATPPG